jgi:hypothetical protein
MKNEKWKETNFNTKKQNISTLMLYNQLPSLTQIKNIYITKKKA